MKRGRKPKDYNNNPIPVPDLENTSSMQTSAACSSPIIMSNRMSFIELVPITDNFPKIHPRKISPHPIMTLEQNRLDLQKMLQAALA